MNLSMPGAIIDRDELFSEMVRYVRLSPCDCEWHPWHRNEETGIPERGVSKPCWKHRLMTKIDLLEKAPS